MRSDSGADEPEYDADDLSKYNNYHRLMFVTRFCSVIANHPLGLQDDLEQLEASAGLSALMDSVPPAASPVDNLLEAERIAACWDEKARQKPNLYMRAKMVKTF